MEPKVQLVAVLPVPEQGIRPQAEQTRKGGEYLLITCLGEDQRWNSLTAIILAAEMIAFTVYLTWIRYRSSVEGTEGEVQA